MDLALDPGDQDLLNFLLEESGDLGAAPGGAAEAPPAWELPLSDVRGGPEPGRCRAGSDLAGSSRPVHVNPVQVESDWDVEDFLSFLWSPAPPPPPSSSSSSSLNSLNSCNSCLVDHDHTYSLPLEPVSIERGEPGASEISGGGEDSTEPGYSSSAFCRWRQPSRRDPDGFIVCGGGGRAGRYLIYDEIIST